MPDKATTRLTQRDIARLAGVSQATVSLVLNNRSEATARIPAETRDRVLKVIRETGYVADPIARRMTKQRNRILGVFTYEPVFPSASGDFYHPFLVGIEERAERLGCDLLLFTSAPVTDGRRRIFHENNRLRLADGCLLLGREIDRRRTGPAGRRGLPVRLGRPPRRRRRPGAVRRRRLRRRHADRRGTGPWTSATGGSPTSGRVPAPSRRPTGCAGFREARRVRRAPHVPTVDRSPGEVLDDLLRSAHHRRVRRGAGRRGRAVRRSGRARRSTYRATCRWSRSVTRRGLPRAISTSPGFHIPREEMGVARGRAAGGGPRAGPPPSSNCCCPASWSTAPPSAATQRCLRCRPMYWWSAAGSAASPRRSARCAPAARWC